MYALAGRSVKEKQCPNFRVPESFSLYAATRPGERRVHFLSFLVFFFPFFFFSLLMTMVGRGHSLQRKSILKSIFIDEYT